ncbi:hypothetical protein EON63_11095 [archaeon]|nr:MAG: hypothetical protein EON63_11095 [archaeon]
MMMVTESERYGYGRLWVYVWVWVMVRECVWVLIVLMTDEWDGLWIWIRVWMTVMGALIGMLIFDGNGDGVLPWGWTWI